MTSVENLFMVYRVTMMREKKTRMKVGKNDGALVVTSGIHIVLK